MKFTYPSDARPIDGFTIRRGIHRGGFGEVYYAVSDAGKEVALKLLTHDHETELRGIRQCLNLKHPNLVTLFDVKTGADGDCWVVMEYVNGSNLEEVLTAFPSGLPIREVHDWMHGLVAGVEYLHDRGLIHRDLKPANVYRENGIVKIGDVGLSKRFDGSRHAHTESIGTVYYMAPEITHGQYGPSVDVYSLGIILFELLTGKLPFNGETSGEILMKQLSAAPDLSAVPVNLRPVLAHALEKDPQKRTPSARQLWMEFEQTFSPPTEIPASHFVNGHAPRNVPVETYRKDTDRNGDTGRKPWKKENEHKPHSLAYEAGRLCGAIQAPIRAGMKSPPKPPGPYGKRYYWEFKWIAALAVIIFVFVPWHMMTSEEAWSIAGAIALCAGFFSFLFWAREHWRPDDEPPAFPMLGKWPQPSSRSDQPGTLAIGGLAAGMFSLVAQLATLNLSHRQHMIDRADTMVFFTAISILGTWALIACRWFDVRNRHPRLMALGAGVLVATLAEFLANYLLIQFGPQNLGGRAMFRELGVNPLQGGPNLQPLWLGYVVFFGGLFFLLGKRFSRMQDSNRKVRWSFWQIAVTAGLTWLWVHLFAFPPLLGMLWMSTIAASVQLASPWMPKTARTKGSR